jgi:PKD repeat protein
VPPAGKNDIFVVFTGTAGSEDIFNINYVEFLGAGVGESGADITITFPSNGWEVNQPFEVAFRIENWRSEQGDGHLHYAIDGGTLEEHEGYEPIPIDGLALGNHTIRLELYNPDDTPSGIFDEVTINITNDISCNETPFPDSWTVHELEENPYTVVYTFADYDLDGDGLKDIVTGGWWYKNPGTASGNWVKNTIGGSFGNVAHVYDFDEDGDMDLLGTTGTYTNAILVWAQNDGEGNFTVFNNIPAGDTDYSEPFLAGLAGGVFDVGGPYQMAINWNGAEQTGSPVQMLTPPDKQNITTETWSLVDISSDSSGEDIQAGDIDRDGDLDLFQGINWLRNNGNGNFETFDTGITYASTPDRAQLADFDRDGDLDAVVGQLGLGGSGNRFEFSWFAAPADPTQPWVRNVLDTDIQGSLSVFATDIDFDGDQDIVVGEWRGQHRLIAFENDLCGSGEFNLRVLDDGGLDLEHHDGARVTDIDNDGDLDVISNGWLNDRIPRIYENTTVPPSNERPITDAGEDRTVMPDTTVTLTGSGSDPDGGDIVTYLWTKQSGPDGDTATLSGADTTELTVENTLEGVYVFRLSVTDDEGDTGFDEVTVTVGEGTPTGGNVTRINAGGPAFTFGENDWTEDQYNNGGDTITNNTPIANTDNDQLYQTERYRTGGSLIYEIPVANGIHSINLHFAEIYWGLPGDGAGGGAGSRLFNIDIEGQARIENYDIFVEAGGPATAIVENFSGINVSDESLTITLQRIMDYPKVSGIEIVAPVAMGAPVADAGADQTISLPENSVVLPGSGTDADGGDVSYLWTQQSGPEATLGGAETAELSVSDMVPGAYVFRLTVTDDEGESGFDEVSVSVLPEGGILAVAEAAPTTGSSPLEVSFTGSNSLGEIASYLWDFKDGNTSTEADPANTFLAEGTYQVELTVTDAGGMSDTTSIAIVVGETASGEMMDVFLEQNPPKDGIAVIRLVNPPENFMMLGINVHDIQGRLVNSYKPEDILVNGSSYQIPVHLLKAGLYFFEIAMNQGEPVTLKVLVKN